MTAIGGMSLGFLAEAISARPGDCIVALRLLRRHSAVRPTLGSAPAGVRGETARNDRSEWVVMATLLSDRLLDIQQGRGEEEDQGKDQANAHQQPHYKYGREDLFVKF